MKPWTLDEDAIVREHYATRGLAWCITELGRTRDAVRTRAQDLGVRQRPRWTDHDDAVLAMGWGIRSLDELASTLGRTPYAVYQRAAKLGVGCGCPQGFEYVSNAAERAGFDKDTMRRILRWAKVHVVRSVSPPPRRSGAASASKPRFIVDSADVDDAVARWCATEMIETAALRLGLSRGTLKQILVDAIARGDERVPQKPSRGRRWRVPSVVLDELVAEYRQRETVAESARRVGVDAVTMRRWLIGGGVDVQPFARLDPNDVDRVVAERLADPKCKARRAA